MDGCNILLLAPGEEEQKRVEKNKEDLLGVSLEGGDIFGSLPESILISLLAFLSPFEVLQKIACLSPHSHCFVRDHWYPIVLDLSKQWAQNLTYAHTCQPHRDQAKVYSQQLDSENVIHSNQIPLPLTIEVGPQFPSVETQFNIQSSGQFISLRLPLKPICYEIQDEDNAHSQDFNITPAEGQRNGRQSLRAGESSVVSLDSNSQLISSYTMLRYLAQETFTFFSIQPCGADSFWSLPAWYRRCLNRLRIIRYNTNGSIKPSPKVERDQTSQILTTNNFNDQLTEPHVALTAESFSILDVCQILTASALSVSQFVLDASPHFSSFLEGPDLPRCPCSLAVEKEMPSHVVTGSHLSLIPHERVHWRCWTHFMRQIPFISGGTEFPKLETVVIGGSYLPAFLSLIGMNDNLTFPTVKTLCFRGALAPGIKSWDIFERDDQVSRFISAASESLESEVTKTHETLWEDNPRWQLEDILRSILFGASPLRSVSQQCNGDELQLIRREEFWVRTILKALSAYKWPSVRTLELRIGPGVAERSLWWGILMDEILKLKSLEVIDLHVSVEELLEMIPEQFLCAYTDQPAVKYSHHPMTPPRRSETRQARRYSQTDLSMTSPRSTGQILRRRQSTLCQSLRHSLLRSSGRLPGVKEIRLTSADSIKPLLILQDYFSSCLGRRVLLQVRRLTLTLIDDSVAAWLHRVPSLFHGPAPTLALEFPLEIGTKSSERMPVVDLKDVSVVQLVNFDHEEVNLSHIEQLFSLDFESGGSDLKLKTLQIRKVVGHAPSCGSNTRKADLEEVFEAHPILSHFQKEFFL